MSRDSFRSIGRFLSVSLVFLVLATPIRAEDRRLISDDVFTWGDLGGIMIQHQNCHGSLDGRAIDGLDVPGEWIEWQLILGEPFCFVDSLRSAGTEGVVREFVFEFIPQPPAVAASQDTMFTGPGAGVG